MKKIILYCLAIFLIGITISSCKGTKSTTKKKTNVTKIVQKKQKAPPQETKTIDKLGIVLNNKDNKFLYETIAEWYGVPHKMGGCSLTGVDCSCFVINIYKKVYNINLNRRAVDMVKDIYFVDKNKMIEGDLLFFANSGGRINHVGIYLKEGMFAHSSSSKGVVVSKISENYWAKAYYKSGRHMEVKTKY